MKWAIFLDSFTPGGESTGCNNDDGIADTPFQERSHRQCPIYPQFSCSSSDMFMNFMDYVNDECMFFFTKGQVERMRSTLIDQRSGLLNNEAECSDEQATENGLYVHPNPNAGEFVLEYRLSENADSKIIVYDFSGKMVHSSQVNQDGFVHLQLSTLSKGMYFISLGNQQTKFVVY